MTKSLPPYPDAPAHPRPQSFVTGEFRCVNCSYTLRGLSTAGVCPECGTPVAHALRNSLLESASPEYRDRLVQGLFLIIAGFPTGTAFIAAGVLWLLVNPPADRVMEAVVVLAVTLPQVMIGVGYWMYTAPEHGFSGANEPIRARQIIRGCTVFMLAFIGLAVLGVLVLPRAQPPRGVARMDLLVVVGVSAFAWLPRFLAMVSYSRWVAGRIPNPRWASLARTHAWLVPPLILGPPLLWILADFVFPIANRTVLTSPRRASGSLLSLVGCFWILAVPVTMFMYWGLLHQLRIELRAIDQVASEPPSDPPPEPPTASSTSTAGS